MMMSQSSMDLFQKFVFYHYYTANKEGWKIIISARRLFLSFCCVAHSVSLSLWSIFRRTLKIRWEPCDYKMWIASKNLFLHVQVKIEWRCEYLVVMSTFTLVNRKYEILVRERTSIVAVKIQCSSFLADELQQIIEKNTKGAAKHAMQNIAV